MHFQFYCVANKVPREGTPSVGFIPHPAVIGNPEGVSYGLIRFGKIDIPAEAFTVMLRRE